MLRIFSWIYQKVLTPVGHFFRAIWRWILAVILIPVGGFIGRHWFLFVLGLLVVAVIVVLFLLRGALFGAGLIGHKPTATPTAEVIAVAATEVPQETAAPTEAPTAAPTEAPTPEPTAVQDAVRLTAGKYLDWTKDKDKYRQVDGTYIVPIDDFLGYQAVLFEGEFYDSVGTHSVCYWYIADGISSDSKKHTTCKLDGANAIHINQGSFWGYSQNEKGDLPDDLLTIFAHDKWQNWHDQGMTGNPIEIRFSASNIVAYKAGEEPKLTPEQILIVDRNAAERCPSSEPEKLENPYSDVSSNSDPVVIGAPGSFACRTLFVGKLTSDGKLIAYYWRGAKDGFSYVAQATSFYLVPESWGESEMGDFAVAKGAAFLGQFTTK